MNDALVQASRRVFQYPTSVTARRHGPIGYVDYTSYKPWLRDEFSFVCVYCLTRERWRPDGQAGFSVEHVLPQVVHPELISDYENLLYVCCACNAYRQETPLPIDPRHEAFGGHLTIHREGGVEHLTDAGRDLIDVCQLNRPTLMSFRRRMLVLLEMLASKTDHKSTELLRDLIGFPDDLPDLARKRPPGGNRRPEGISTCFFQQNQRHELPEVY